METCRHDDVRGGQRVGNAPAVRRRRRALATLIALGLVALVLAALVAVVVTLRTNGSVLTRLAHGTWSCTTVGDEDTDVYGTPHHEPFDVVVGDGTFAIPSRRLAGTWALRGATLHVDAVATGPARPGATVEVTGLPAGLPELASGSSPAVVRGDAAPARRYTLGWSASTGHLTVGGGTGIARTGVRCEK